ncbi:hypothetical protein [Thermopirellula anaerolimosa]
MTYPGFYDYRYYARDYGGRSGEEDYIAYVGDAFYENPGSDGGFFLFAYSEDQLLFAGAAGDRTEEQGISVPAGVPGTERVSVLQQEHQYYFGTEGGSGKNGISAMAANETVGRAQGGQVRVQGEAAGGGAQRLPEWRWWNPFTWFGWGIDWSEAVDQEIELVRQLNQTFGTAHTRLDQFTAEERARIEQALGRKFNWEQASAIRASERELQIRDKVLLGSQVSLAGAAVADAAAGGVAVYQAATGTTILVEGASVGGRMGSGGIFQIRPAGKPPLIRFDYHAIRPGGAKVPHIDSPPLGWRHWPWE